MGSSAPHVYLPAEVRNRPIDQHKLKDFLYTKKLARIEAEALIALLDREAAHETEDHLRSLISPGKASDPAVRKYRHEILIAFNVLAYKRRARHHGCNPGQVVIPALLEATVLECIQKRNWTLGRIAVELGTTLGLVQKMSARHGWGRWRRGHGHRFTPEEQAAERRKRIARAQRKKQIFAALRDRARTMRSVEREFGVDGHTLIKYRRRMKIFKDRRFRKKLSPSQIAEAQEQLDAGGKWRATAAHFGVVLATLQKYCRPTGRRTRRPRLAEAAA